MEASVGCGWAVGWQKGHLKCVRGILINETGQTPSARWLEVHPVGAKPPGFTQGSAESGRFTQETIDQSRWGSQDLALVIGQGFLAPSDPALPFVKVDGQRTKQGQIPCRGRMADGAAIFILGAISPEVLAVFNAPMDPRPFQQLFGTGFLYPEAGHQIGDLDGFLDD